MSQLRSDHFSLAMSSSPIGAGAVSEIGVPIPSFGMGWVDVMYLLLAYFTLVNVAVAVWRLIPSVRKGTSDNESNPTVLPGLKQGSSTVERWEEV